MFKYTRIFLAVLAIFLITGCDNGGTGSGGSDGDVGMVEQATPPDGKVTLQCATFEWWITDNGDRAKVSVVIARRTLGTFTLTADNPEKNFHYGLGKCTAYGRILMHAKSVWGTGSLQAANITIQQGSSSVTHQGVLAQW